ncbi:MAG: protein kinase [Gammaproteobacteria bacterium]|nr:protein kinase [Gammaproteobacteria bacterium]
MRILLIDDDADFRVLLKKLIRAEWSRAVVDEIDPLQTEPAPRDIDAKRYDLVLLDHQMGHISGLQLLKSFRQIPKFPPVVMLTAFGNERLAAAAIKCGADDYLPKSRLTSSQLVTTIRESLRGALGPKLSPMAFSSRRKRGGSAVGVSIKGYDVTEKIATGPASAVFLAHSHNLNKKVVLKILYGAFELSDEHELLERFLIEYQSISAIKHPNIVEIYDVGVADDHAFIVMEFIEGGSLRTRLQQSGSLAPDTSLKIAFDLVGALAAIHDVGILHRDLKPGNVMFRRDGSLCIIDFGLAKQVQIEQAITQPGKIYGTPYYMSPEQGQGLAIDIRSDFYNLGVLLFELLTGHKPYVAGTPVALVFKHTYAPLPELPEKLNKYQFLIDSLMAKKPADRPQSSAQIFELLKHCQTL